jgi:preprotein translocase subunit YajC
MQFGSELIWLLAEGAAKPQDPPFWSMLPPILAMVALFFVLMIWPQQKEKQKRDVMLNALKKNDRVVTIGGMIGTIANVSADGKEYTLKIDDNTRAKFVRTGISHKLDEEAAKEEPAKPA